MIGTLISKFKEKLWDIDINNLTVSHLENKACNTIITPISANFSADFSTNFQPVFQRRFQRARLLYSTQIDGVALCVDCTVATCLDFGFITERGVNWSRRLEEPRHECVFSIVLMTNHGGRIDD